MPEPFVPDLYDGGGERVTLFVQLYSHVLCLSPACLCVWEWVWVWVWVCVEKRHALLRTSALQIGEESEASPRKQDSSSVLTLTLMETATGRGDWLRARREKVRSLVPDFDNVMLWFPHTQHVTGKIHLASKQGATTFLSAAESVEKCHVITLMPLIMVERVDGAHYTCIDVLDDPNAPLLQHVLPEGIAALIEAENNPEIECIIVHCQAGISRSASLVIAFLMHAHNHSLEDAYEIVLTARPCIAPNDGFLLQLSLYHAIGAPSPSHLDSLLAAAHSAQTDPDLDPDLDPEALALCRDFLSHTGPYILPPSSSHTPAHDVTMYL